MNKDYILYEIKRIADESGGKSPGQNLFEKASGIKKHSWHGKYWRSWSDALAEAGLQLNQKIEAINEEILLSSLCRLTQKLGRFPAKVDFIMARRENPDFPSHSTLDNRLGPQRSKIDRVRKYASGNAQYADILPLLPEVSDQENLSPATETENTSAREGFVYLAILKIDNVKRYKIGKTNLVERRSTELSLQLPEKLQLLHSIQTDDMDGIERYWHQRFADKRKHGEWFDLTAQDVRIFSSRRTM